MCVKRQSSLERAAGREVEIKDNKGKGKIILKYGSLEDLTVCGSPGREIKIAKETILILIDIVNDQSDQRS